MKNRVAWVLLVVVGLVVAQGAWGGLIALGDAPDPSEAMEAYNRWQHHYYLISAAGLVGILMVVAGLLWGLLEFLTKREMHKLQGDDWNTD
jgi:hypothetical protein